MAEVTLVSPIRLQTYRDEKNNTQTYQWVLSEYEEDQLAKWKSVINGADVVVQEVSTVDVVSEMYFYVTKNTTSGNAVLATTQQPTLTYGGECTYGGDLESFDITSDIWALNALQIFINGVKQVKGTDVKFYDTNQLIITQRLQVGDYITIDYVEGQ